MSMGSSESYVPSVGVAGFNSDASSITQRATFGAGCYWGTEKFLRFSFPKSYPDAGGKVTSGAVGFMGPVGSKEHPSYREVCSGSTGHVEVYDFQFSGDAATYEALVKFFFQFHDPTTLNSQGGDRGTQYASVIFCFDPIQVEIATRVKNELQRLIDSGKVTAYEGRKVTTDIRRANKFYPAHAEHQDYLTENPTGYCNHRIRFPTWPA